MHLRKNTLQNIFLIILATTVSFNGSINPILIQISSINFIIFFLLCLRNNKLLERIKENYLINRVFFIFFLIYIIFLIKSFLLSQTLIASIKCLLPFGMEPKYVFKILENFLSL